MATNSTRTLTVRQVADRLQLTTRTIKRFLASGALGCVDVSVTPGRATIRVTEAQLATFLRKRTRRRSQ